MWGCLFWFLLKPANFSWTYSIRYHSLPWSTRIWSHNPKLLRIGLHKPLQYYTCMHIYIALYLYTHTHTLCLCLIKCMVFIDIKSAINWPFSDTGRSIHPLVDPFCWSFLFYSFTYFPACLLNGQLIFFKMAT